MSETASSMSETYDPYDPKMDRSRRNALVSTCAVGAVGAAGVAYPLMSSMQPSERARAAGAPVEADISGMRIGELRRVEWRGKPVWVVRRSPEMLKSLEQTDPLVLDPKSQNYYQEPTPEYAQNQARSIKPEYLVVVGICSHLGCSPSTRFEEGGVQGSFPGFFCPCHGSTFDMAGRVFKNKPANANLDVPPYAYLTDTKLTIGEDAKKS